MSRPSLTIIIPTTCRPERTESLLNAIASIERTAPASTAVLVAINGAHVDEASAASLAERSNLRVVRFTKGSLAETMARALQLVTTDFFGFLDDDDEFLEDGLRKRLEALRSHGDADFVLSNGWRCSAGHDEPYLQYLDRVQEDPLQWFFVENWLPSCGATFRRSSVEISLFEDYHSYAEWSWLAFRLAMSGKRMLTLNIPTFRVHIDTPASESKSRAYKLSYIALYERMLAAQPPARVRSILRRRLAQAHHDTSQEWLAEGNRVRALRHHFKSLATPFGWRFIFYTRHIFGTPSPHAH